MMIETIPCLNDNYAYLLTCPETQKRAVIDPSEAAPVLKHLNGRFLDAILLTHHHWDHTGGNDGLLKVFPELDVYGHRSDRGRIQGQTHDLEDGAQFDLGQLDIRGIFNPGHTSGAISYWLPKHKAVFTGDTLFSAGCGRVFEGSMSQMYESLNFKIGGLPQDTAIYFGHEYTCQNLAFALTLEPQNKEIQAYLALVQSQRERGEFSTPSTLALEYKINPFMRCEQESILNSLKAQGLSSIEPVTAFQMIRQLKDRF